MAAPRDERQERAEADGGTPGRTRAVRKVAILILGLLFLQYLLGMGTSLFVEFPSKTAGVNPLESVFGDGPYLVAVHLVTGIALGLGSIGGLVLSALARSRTLVTVTLAGLGAILLAGESGIEFVLGWYSDDLFSFLMSFGFILAFTLYFLLFWYTSGRRTHSATNSRATVTDFFGSKPAAAHLGSGDEPVRAEIPAAAGLGLSSGLRLPRKASRSIPAEESQKNNGGRASTSACRGRGLRRASPRFRLIS